MRRREAHPPRPSPSSPCRGLATENGYDNLLAGERNINEMVLARVWCCKRNYALIRSHFRKLGRQFPKRKNVFTGIYSQKTNMSNKAFIRGNASKNKEAPGYIFQNAYFLTIYRPNSSDIDCSIKEVFQCYLSCTAPFSLNRPFRLVFEVQWHLTGIENKNKSSTKVVSSTLRDAICFLF